MAITQKDLEKLAENIIHTVSVDIKKQLSFQKKELESHLDQKFEKNRRQLVDEMQNFQDAIITEVKSIK